MELFGGPSRSIGLLVAMWMGPVILRGRVRVEMPQRCGRDEMRSKLVPLFSASWKLAVRMIELTDGRCQVSAGCLREERERHLVYFSVVTGTNHGITGPRHHPACAQRI